MSLRTEPVMEKALTGDYDQGSVVPTPPESYESMLRLGFPEHTAVYLSHIVDSQGSAREYSQMPQDRTFSSLESGIVRELRPTKGLLIANVSKEYQTMSLYDAPIGGEKEALSEYMYGQMLLGLFLAKKTEGVDQYLLPIFQINHAGGERSLLPGAFQTLSLSRADALMILGRLTEHIYSSAEQYNVVMSVVTQLRSKYERVE